MATARDREFRGVVVKLGIFAVVMILVFALLVVVFSQYRSGSTTTYSAQFDNASQIKSGANVRIAGVRVGSVGSVALNDDNTAVVDFTVESTYRLPVSARALIRYENLTGDRYLEITQGAGDTNRYLSENGRIPESQTEPALDLDKLLGGFKPLFQTLKPEQVNELSESLINTFQGQGPALTKLLAQTASFTQTLADRDQLIGSVIDNLNGTLGTLDADKGQLDTSLVQLQQLVTGLNAQRNTIGSAVSSTADLTNGLADLLQTNRPNLTATVASTGVVAQNVLDDSDYVRGLLSRLPDDYLRLSNIGSYGAWFQLWLCQINISITGPNNQQLIWRVDDTRGSRQNPGGRCDAPKENDPQ